MQITERERQGRIPTRQATPERLRVTRLSSFAKIAWVQPHRLIDVLISNRIAIALIKITIDE
jgi:hypothetical protein